MTFDEYFYTTTEHGIFPKKAYETRRGGRTITTNYETQYTPQTPVYTGTEAEYITYDSTMAGGYVTFSNSTQLQEERQKIAEEYQRQAEEDKRRYKELMKEFKLRKINKIFKNSIVNGS